MNRKLKYGVALLGMFALLRFACTAQNVQVIAHIDSSNILIGEQVHLHLIANYDASKGAVNIKWPSIADTLMTKVKVVGRSRIDTVMPDKTNPNLRQQREDLLITSFDSGYYAIPPFTFIINGDTANTAQTEPVLLQVHTVAVDTTKGIRDIKAPVTAPFSIYEILPYVGIGLAALVVVIVGLYFFVKWLDGKKKPAPVVIKAPPVLPHIKALNELEKLAEKKLWQEGKVKEYHSSISDILRVYIDERFGINAPEMITSDIVQAMRRLDLDEILKAKLKQALVLADLVKFAKEQPLPTENDLSMNSAIEFVKNSIPVVKAPEPVKVETQTQAATLPTTPPAQS